MKFLWLILFAVAALLLKENSCVPSIRALSPRPVSFPEDNWDDCFLDEESTQPGLCKTIEECPVVLSKWDNEKIYPKTCYFIKTEQFVCCPVEPPAEPPVEPPAEPPVEPPAEPPVEPPVEPPAEPPVEAPAEPPVEAPAEPPAEPVAPPVGPVIFPGPVAKEEENAEAPATEGARSTTKRHSNIFLDKVHGNIISTTNRPSNIFLDKFNADKTTSQTPPVSSPSVVFNTEKGPFVKKRAETECKLQNQHKFEVDGPSSGIKEFPFMAVLGWQSSSDDKIFYACGGVLISSRFVLTGAHCAELGGDPPKFVHLGGENLQDSQEGIIKIKRFVTHPGFNATTIYNDIALVELEQEVNDPMACLWTEHDLPITKLMALGYGQANFESLSSNQFFKAALNVIDKEQCQAYYKLDEKLNVTDIVDAHLCAGDVAHAHSSCQGDTGGPLIMELDKIFYVVGITTFGLGCADLPPSIYTRVSSFSDWIAPIVWPEIDIRFD